MNKQCLRDITKRCPTLLGMFDTGFLAGKKPSSESLLRGPTSQTEIQHAQAELKHVSGPIIAGWGRKGAGDT